MKQFSGKQLLKAAIKFKMNKSNSLVSAFAAVLFSVLLHCFYLVTEHTSSFEEQKQFIDIKLQAFIRMFFFILNDL